MQKTLNICTTSVVGFTYLYFFVTSFAFFFVDRRNGKAIINSHTQVEVPGFKPDHDIRPNNFGILSVELGLLDSFAYFYSLFYVFIFEETNFIHKY